MVLVYTDFLIFCFFNISHTAILVRSVRFNEIIAPFDPSVHALAERLVAVPASVPPQIAVAAAAVFVHIAAADTVVSDRPCAPHYLDSAAAAFLVPFAAGTPFAVGPVDAAVVSVAVVVAAAGQTWHFVAAFAVPLGIHSSAVDTASCNS